MTIGIRVVAGHPIAVIVDGHPAALRPKERVVVAGLALRHPEPISLNQLISLVWPDEAPATAKQSIHNHLARLRTTVPGLVATTPAGYSFGAGVSLHVERPIADPASGGDDADADASGTGLLIELADVSDLRRARIEFRRRHSPPEAHDLANLLQTTDVDALIASLEARVGGDGCDERAWWLLAVAEVKRGGIGAGTAVLARARSAMSEVGLGVGRRLVDLDGMLRDRVDNVDVLVRDAYGSPRGALLEHRDAGIARRASDVRTAWEAHERFVVVLRGPDDAHRRALLARVVDDARASGFSTASARLRVDDLGSPSITTSLLGGRPLVAVVDICDPGADLSLLLRRIAARLDQTPVGWVVTGDADPEAVSAAVGHGASEGRVSIRHSDTAPGTLGLETASPGVHRLLAALATLGEPVPIDDLDAAIPAARALALEAARAGFVRVDATSRTIDLASSDVADAALAPASEADRAEIARGLCALELPALDHARREDLRSRWSTRAFGAGDERTVARTLAAAGAYVEHGEYDVAAAIIGRVLDPIARTEGRSASWCRLAIEAGRALLAAGDAAGDALLADVVAVASDIGDDELAARSTLEWCRLGAAGGVGPVDTRRMRVVDELLDRLADPGDRARVGAAAAMVLSLAGDPDLLRTRFDDSVRDADASGDPTVAAEVLPLAYMAVPLHRDLQVRANHADRLLRLADGLGRADLRWEGLQIRYSCEVMRSDPAYRGTVSELHDVAARLHEQSREWEMHYIRSNVAILDGDLDGARREVDESLVFAGPVDADRVAAVFGAHHLVASMLDGSVGDLLDSLRTLATDQPGIGAWHAAHAAAAAAAGEHDEAVAALAHVTGAGVVALVRDPVYSAGLVAIGEAAAATGDPTALAVADAALDELAGTWSWCGSCTFGPIDLTRARVARTLGDTARAETLATAAVITSGEMRAPSFTRQATELLVSLATPIVRTSVRADPDPRSDPTGPDDEGMHADTGHP
ncbi:MAG: hypothetical protein ABJH68_13295 [Ilumatobacter sp.]|uniref:hypothetical protein n=2 Tax=Ilumatobacter sp. TaxID=1967498 RepID=UPI0032996492